MADRADEPGGLKGHRDPGRGGDIGRERLLHQDVDARVGKRERDLFVESGRHRDRAHVDARPDETLDRAEHRHAVRDPVPVAGGVRDADQIHPVQAPQHPHVVAAHHAQAHDAGPQGGHANPPRLVVPTGSSDRQPS